MSTGHRLEARQCHSRFDGDDLVGRGVLDHSVESLGSNDDVETIGRRSDLEVRSTSDESQRFSGPFALGDPRGRVVDCVRQADNLRHHADDGIILGRRAGGDHTRSAWPESSAECGR